MAHGLTQAAQDSSWLQTAASELYTWLQHAEEQYSLGTESFLKQAIETCVESAQRERAELSQKEGREQVDAAHWLKKALTPELDRLRTIAVALARDVTADFFSSPSIVHQIVLGLHPKSPFVSIRTVCTVMDQDELSLCPSGEEPPPRFPNAKSPGAMEHNLKNRKENVSMKNIHISLDKDARKAENFSPQPRNAPSVTPSADGMEDSTSDNSYSDSSAQLVYALGRIGYDFVSQSRRDSIKQKMGESARPEEPNDILAYLDAHPYDASAMQWTLDLESTPIYVIEPRGAFARDAYNVLRQFLREQITEGVERVSIPGVIVGMTRHRSGTAIPVVAPEIRGMYSWTTEALVSAVVGPAPEAGAVEEGQEAYRERRSGVTNFLERVYYEIRNLGREPQERALNFAATNAFQVERVYERAIQEEMELDTIEVDHSPVCPPGADCWDVKLLFFFPQRQVQTVRRVYRFTVDVTDVVPATVGPMRSWSIR